MRGDQRMGRFSIDYETMSNDEGTVDDLRIPVGNQVEWYVWDLILWVSLLQIKPKSCFITEYSTPYTQQR